MAIHIWRDGAYRSVDLAQYGQDGTLTGAYQWRDGAWRTLWEPAPSVTPATLGAIHWLPFTTTPGEDLGSDPIDWSVGTSVVSGGSLTSGRVQMPYPEPPTYTPVGGSSLTGWVYPTHTLSNIGAAPLSLTASFSRIEFRYHGGTRTAQWRFRRGATAQQNIDGGTVPHGEWVHVAACMEPVSGTTWRYRAYLDGVEVVNGTYNAGTQEPVSVRNFVMNAQTGRINDAAAYNHPLDPADIAALHAAGRTT